MDILLCAPLLILDDSSNELPYKTEYVEKLDGRKTTRRVDELTQYMKEEGENPLLIALPATNGHLSIRKIGTGLSMCAKYTLGKEMTSVELEALIEYTKGQMSDGAGEGWVQDLWDETGLNLEVDYEELKKVN